jgi:HSP20 family molecular chaperone IbpA
LIRFGDSRWHVVRSRNFTMREETFSKPGLIDKIRDRFIRKSNVDIARWSPKPQRWNAWSPAFEVREDSSSIKVSADLPGVRQQDLEIEVLGRTLTISGKREIEEAGPSEQIFEERPFGRFTRAFTLPDYVDLEHATSKLENGVLTIVVTKAPSRARKIEVRASTKP